MKLRIRDNSLRLRLDRREIAALAETGRVDAVCRFSPAASLSYSVVAGGEAQDCDLRAEFLDGGITISVRRDRIRALAETGIVGVESSQQSGAGAELRLLLEKDFQCLTDRPGEDDSHAFANPLAAHTCAAHK